MKPWLRFALTAIAGVAIVIAYRVYNIQKTKKKPRKLIRNQDGAKEISDNKKTEKLSPTQKKHKTKKIRVTTSDILHPLPFDNVTGTMPKSGKSKEETSKKVDGDNSMKCIGSPTETDVENNNISFRSSEYIKAPKIPKGRKSNKNSSAEPKSDSRESENLKEMKSEKVESKETSSSKENDSKKSPEATVVKEESKKTEEDPKKKEETSSTQPSTEKKTEEEKPKTSEGSPASDMILPKRTESMDGRITFGSCIPSVAKNDTGLSNITSPANSDRGALDMISSLSHSSASSETIQTMYKMCRCRKNKRNEIMDDAQKPKFDSTIKVDVAPTEVLPVNFITYKPPNLFEPSGELTELPSICFEVPDNKADNYLSPLQPILNASHAAHYHACLINHLIENFDFFE